MNSYRHHKPSVGHKSYFGTKVILEQNIIREDNNVKKKNNKIKLFKTTQHRNGQTTIGSGEYASQLKLSENFLIRRLSFA